MSFILDALKKSETDRQRQSGPALFEVRVAPPRNGLPVWAIGLAVLLAINLVIVAWTLLRRPAPAEQAGTPATQGVSPPAVAPGSTGMAVAGSPGPQQPQSAAPATTATPVSGAAPVQPLAQTAGMTQPAAAGTAQPGSTTGPPAAGGAPMANAYPQQSTNNGGGIPSATDSTGTQAATTGEKLNPDDYAPAADPSPAAPFGNHVSRGTTSGVPLYQDAALNSHLPSLRLDLHVYAAKPQERFVMINMHKLHEGDSLPEGVRVESITPDGAVLSQNGAKFLLPRE